MQSSHTSWTTKASGAGILPIIRFKSGEACWSTRRPQWDSVSASWLLVVLWEIDMLDVLLCLPAREAVPRASGRWRYRSFVEVACEENTFIQTHLQAQGGSFQSFCKDYQPCNSIEYVPHAATREFNQPSPSPHPSHQRPTTHP